MAISAHDDADMATLIRAGTVALLCVLATAGAGGAGGGARAADAKIAIVAAENFYGSVAAEIGGERVVVNSILNSPDQDPHLFEVSPAVIRQIAAAQVVLYNGADYDPWMAKLVAVTERAGRVAIVAADLRNRKPGDNPHLWYDPATMPAVARALAAALTSIDPSGAGGYAARLKAFLASLDPLNEKIAAIRDKYAGAPVTASEPVFGEMANALKLDMRNRRFQLAIMNDTEPGAGDLAAVERDLRTHAVRAFFYNKQATTELVRHLVDVAHAAHVPVVGVTETEPAGMSYPQWMLMQLEQTERALAGPSS
jgi:zinc/manganese transport system substrate-binding protein